MTTRAIASRSSLTAQGSRICSCLSSIWVLLPHVHERKPDDQCQPASSVRRSWCLAEDEGLRRRRSTFPLAASAAHSCPEPGREEVLCRIGEIRCLEPLAP